MENEMTMAQLRNDARILRGKIHELKRNTLTFRPFSSRDLMILEDMLGGCGGGDSEDGEESEQGGDH